MMSSDDPPTSSIGQAVNPVGIPEKCPHCKKPLVTRVDNYSAMWHDGDVVCDKCGGFIRSYDAG
jgi:ribosomal protein L37AE/L43A